MIYYIEKESNCINWKFVRFSQSVEKNNNVE